MEHAVIKNYKKRVSLIDAEHVQYNIMFDIFRPEITLFIPYIMKIVPLTTTLRNYLISLRSLYKKFQMEEHRILLHSIPAELYIFTYTVNSKVP
jgi:hypothetical protein